ncbi:GTP-binding protein [Caproiciproducens sp. LBM24188]|nr:TetM/TetW/TetO/TetS family tetracycline resistance ribosomal protection protein [Oscillospiraceae bacterium]HHV30900.1 TetM/TetW/TetO/TetS family tetracycline resistance ribosomal protection protein [Clostridiales bacterium]
MSITVGILAHVDAGKTTLSEQILYRAGTLRAPGRVDRKNTFLDYNEVERERGITVFADQAAFQAGGRAFQLIDTPGHVDFSGEMERSLWVMDCAVLVISCVEGIQSHTETIWRLLRRNQVPTFLFLNKTDRAGADPEGVLREAERLWGAVCPDFTGYQGEEMEPRTVERLAELDETLLDTYCSSGYDPQLWHSAARRMTRDCRIFPAFRGSALNGQGVEEFLRAFSLLAPEETGDASAPLAARVYKVRHEKQGGRVAFLKITAGTLHPKEEICCPGDSGEPITEKCNELRGYNGAKYTLIPQAVPGDLCAVTGLSTPMPGDVVGASPRRMLPFSTQPLLAAKVLFDTSIPPKTMLEHLRELEDEEPLLGVSWEEELQEIRVHIMGEIQLEVLAELMRERFGLEIGFGPCEILYRETLGAPVVGCGHFEPLRHYAEVHLRLSPGPRGSGIVFASECSTDVLAAGWQNLIRTHVLEKEHRGVLTGAPLTDVKVTLLAGRAHLKHTEGGDFRQATYRAIRQGLMHAQSVLLEPYYAFEIEVELSLTGRVFSDILRRNGTYETPQTEGDRAIIRGRAPVSEMMDYAKELTAFSKGKGKLSLTFDGYEPCHNAQEVIQYKAYDPERDIANTPDSVFCSHGAGYRVKWDEAPTMMHLKLEEEKQGDSLT